MEVTLGTGALEKTDRNAISYDTKVKTECGAPLHSVSFQVELSDSLLLSNDQLNILPQNIFSDSETIKSAVGEDFDRVKLESEGNEVKDCKRKTVTNKNNDRKDKVQEEKSDEETTVNDDGKNVGKNTAVETNGTSDRNKTLKELNSSKKSTPKSKKGFQIDLIVNRLKTSQANEISPTPCKTTANISKGLAKTQYDTDEKSTTCETTLKYVKTECGSMQCLGCNTVYTLMTELENHFQICGTGSCSEGKVTEESQKDLDNEHNEAAIKPEPGDVENTNGCVTVAASDNCIQTNLSSQGNGRHSTKCPFCHEKFDGYIEYLDHKYMCQNSGIHTDGSDIKLEPNVSEEYSSDAYLSSHVTSDVGTNECVSNELGITGMFYNTGARVVEINNASSDNLQFHCQACGLQFGTIYELSGHSYNCTQRQEVSSGSEAPARGVTAVDYSCRKCEASFNSGKELIGHRLKCTGKKKTGVAVNISKKIYGIDERYGIGVKPELGTPPASKIQNVEWKTTIQNNLQLCQEAINSHLHFCRVLQKTTMTETNFMFVLENGMLEMAISGLCEGALYGVVFGSDRKKYVRFFESGVFQGFFESKGLDIVKRSVDCSVENDFLWEKVFTDEDLKAANNDYHSALAEKRKKLSESKSRKLPQSGRRYTGLLQSNKNSIKPILDQFLQHVQSRIFEENDLQCLGVFVYVVKKGSLKDRPNLSYYSASQCFSGQEFPSAINSYREGGFVRELKSLQVFIPLELPVTWNQQLEFISSFPNMHKWQSKNVSFSQWLPLMDVKGKYKPASARNQILFYFHEGFLDQVYSVCSKLRNCESQPGQSPSSFGKKTSSKRKAKEPIDDETKVTLTTPPDSIVEKVEGKPRSRRRLKCNLCKRTFKNDGLLSQHLVSEHIETVQGDVDTDKSETDGDQKGNEKKRKQDDEDSDYNDSAVESPKVVKRRRRSIKNVQAFPNSKCGTNSSMESEMKVETGVVPVKLEKNGEGSDTNAVFDRKMALRLKVQRNFEERQKMASLNKLDPEYRSFLPKLGAIGFYHCFFEHCGQPFLNEEMFLMHIKEEIIRQNTVYPYYVSTKAMSPQELKDNLKSIGLSMLVFSCNHEKCQHIYFTLEEMKKHIIEAHTKFRFPCEKEGCMRGFETKNELKSHIIVDHSVAKCVKSSFTPSLQETVETVYQQQLLNISKTQESMMTIPEKGNQTAPVKFEEVLKSYSIDKITSLIMENEKKMAMLKQLEDQSKVGTLAKKENLQKRGQLAVKQKEQKQRRKKKVKKKGNIMNRKGDSDNGSEAEDMNHDESENDLEDNQGKERKGLGNISEISVNSRDTIAVNTKQATSIFNGEAKDGAADNVPVLGSYSKENLDHIEKEVNLEVPDVLNEDRLFEKFLLKNDSEDLLDENEDLIGSSSNESSTIDVVGIDSKACIEDKKGHFKLKISLKSKKSLKNTGSLKAILGKAFRKKKSKLKQKCLSTRLNKVVDGESENADNFHGVEKDIERKEKIHEKKAFIRKKKERKSCKSTNSDERSDVNNRLSKDENGDDETGATLVTSSAVELDRERSEEAHDKKAFIRLAKTKRRKKNDKIADKVICNSSLCQNINKSNYPEVPDPENENMSNTSRKEKVEDVSKETEKEPSYTDTITAYSCKSKSCKEVFTSQNALRDHVRAAHMNIQVCVYKCPVSDCFEVFTSKTELDNHKMSDHNVDLNDGKAADKAGNGDNFADSGYMCPVCKKAFSEEKEAVQHSKNCQKRAFLKSVYRATGAENVLPYKNHWTTRKNSLSTDKKLISSEETQSIIGALYGKVETDKVSKLAEKVDNTENLDSFVKENLNENNLDKQKIDMTPFSCRNCFLECSSELELSIHIQNAHDPEGLNKIPCKLCPRFFPSEAFLQEHYTLYHGNHPYKCGRRACRAVFLSRVEFDLHLAMHDEMKFICDVPGCNRAFKFRPSLMKHKSEDHACICSLCPFQTESFKELQAHLKTAHKKWPHHCQTDSCKMSFETKDELRQHIEKSHWELDISRLPYKCTGLGCTQGFLHKKDYNQHKEVCDKVMTFPCQFCNMIFASQVSLECHRSADHVLKCGNCSLTFITVNQLRNHMVKSHSQFECETCKEKFTSRDKLQFHVYSFHAKRTVSNDSKSKSFNDISMVTFSTSATEITSPEIEMKSEPLDEYERENSHSYTDVAIKSEPLDEHQYEIETMFDCVPQEMQSAVDVKIEEVGNG